MDAKICGINDSRTLSYITKHNHPPKFIGFIVNYKKSKRYIEFKKLKELININKKKINFRCQKKIKFSSCCKTIK